MKYCFCFSQELAARAATVERKKLDRGVAIIARWKNDDAPTVTYEVRADFDGTIRYRVKFNATVWASFTQADPELCDEFRQALNELADARMKSEVEERRDEDNTNRDAASDFFRAPIPDDSAADQRAARIATERVVDVPYTVGGVVVDRPKT
jgi:hypothetical protein